MKEEEEDRMREEEEERALNGSEPDSDDSTPPAMTPGMPWTRSGKPAVNIVFEVEEATEAVEDTRI